MFFRFFFLATLFTLFACEKASQEIWIDNPSKEIISVKFDGEAALDVGPRQTIVHETMCGSRTVSVNGGSDLSINLEEGKKYLLNPLEDRYYIESIEVFTSAKKREEYKKYHPESELRTSFVEGIEVEGEFELRKALLMEKDWEFDPSESPETFSGFRSNVKKDRYTVKNIHRRFDLVRKFANDFNFEMKTKFQELQAKD